MNSIACSRNGTMPDGSFYSYAKTLTAWYRTSKSPSWMKRCTTRQAKRREEKEKKKERFFSPENFRGAKRNERKKRRTCKKIVVAGGGEDASRAQRHKQRSPETNLEASESGGYLLSHNAVQYHRRCCVWAALPPLSRALAPSAYGQCIITTDTVA